MCYRHLQIVIIMRFSANVIDAHCPSNVPLDTPLWPFKQNETDLKEMQRSDPYTFSSQYQQHPSPYGGGMFKDEYWHHYDIMPSLFSAIRIYCDTAQKTSECHDFSVFQCWGKVYQKGIFLIDQCRGKWEAPALESNLIDFWEKHKSRYGKQGAQCIKIEDKSSGSSLIQSIKNDYTIPVEPIPRTTDKVLRAMGVIKYFASGHVFLPKSADWLYDYKDEFRKFTPLMTHKHDDQIDPTMDAVEDLLINDSHLYNEQIL